MVKGMNPCPISSFWRIHVNIYERISGKKKKEHKERRAREGIWMDLEEFQVRIYDLYICVTET
jgi:hypothetical protein